MLPCDALKIKLLCYLIFGLGRELPFRLDPSSVTDFAIQLGDLYLGLECAVLGADGDSLGHDFWLVLVLCRRELPWRILTALLEVSFNAVK